MDYFRKWADRPSTFGLSEIEDLAEEYTFHGEIDYMVFMDSLEETMSKKNQFDDNRNNFAPPG